MKPRLFHILIAGLALLSLAGCGTARFSRTTLYEDLPSISEVTARVKEGSLSDQGLVLEISNATGLEFTYDMTYAVEQYRDGQWYRMDGEQIFTSLAAILKPNETNEFSATWDKTLSQGRYRVVKPVNTSRGPQDLAVEFTVE